MTEVLLNAILNLFALISSERGEQAGSRCRKVVEAYLSAHVRLGNPAEYLGLFDELFDFAQLMDGEARRKMGRGICENLKGKLPRQEQVIALLNLLVLLADAAEGEDLSSFGMLIASALDIDGGLYEALSLLTLHPTEYDRLTEDFLVLDSGGLPEGTRCRRLVKPGFRAGWTILRVAETGTLLLVPTGPGRLTIDNQPALAGSFYVVGPGTILHDSQGAPCYHAEILAALSGGGAEDRLDFVGEHLDFRFPGSDNGLHDFSFRETSGRMIGIMGGSGAGKSTLLGILSGSQKPDTGHLLVNGHDIYARGRELEGLIGFVPQDDLLFDDLTVYQNLYFNARLCLANLSEAELRARVEQTLRELDQWEIRDLKVGSPLEKTISGGQRKRLNIALELIRRPAILFADEPTSGLSSADSLNVISLLKEQAVKGRLVIVVIHQPSSAIFKLFDSLWVLDKGGRPVYAGNPLDALVYFRSAVHLAGMDEAVCGGCGNVNPEQIFEILDLRVVDQNGCFTDQRQISAQQWHQRFLDSQAEGAAQPEQASRPVPRRLWKPGPWGQFRVFLERNVLARLANRQYVLINLLEAPLIALVLAVLCRFSPGDEYVFMLNDNIAMFFFMSVVVAVFLGLSVSAEEIIKDRTILRREGFLKLSWFSYINSKLVYLLGVMALETLVFSLVGAAVLEIPDLTLKLWAVLFSCAACSAVLGLNISAALRSVVAVYVLLPLLLIPQMLLSGSAISFDQLVSAGAGHNRVPWYADAMPSRWGYEALIVEQYAANRYQQDLFADDCLIRQTDYLLDSYLSELRSMADFPFFKNDSPDREKTLERNARVLASEVPHLERLVGVNSGLSPDQFQTGAYDREAQKRLKRFLDQAAKELRARRTAAYNRRTTTIQARLDALGRDGFERLKRENYNKSVAQVARNAGGLEGLRISGDRLVQLAVPVCKPPDSPWGRAHFAAAHKNLAGRPLPTFYFNLAFLWFLSLLLYLALYFRLLPRILKSDPTRRSG